MDEKINRKTSVVVTSISAPNDVLKELAKGCRKNDWNFYVIGDSKSPATFELEGAEFYSLEKQKQLPFTLAALCPEKHYSRKNLGYLLAIKNGSEVIVETDDDNIPLSGFWEERRNIYSAFFAKECGWTNIYKHFSTRMIWPRGFPLNLTFNLLTELSTKSDIYVPIQQGLADGNPDVDAIYRMTLELPFSFDKNKPAALGKNAWCPFNSQNTSWFQDAFPLLYLPSFCSFRMTDIWRSFVAQRIGWTCGWNILFHNATVFQERNDHDLLKDFEEEIPGYLNNSDICRALEDLELKAGKENIFDNLRTCYETIVENGWINNRNELVLLDAWIKDLENISQNGDST